MDFTKLSDEELEIARFHCDESLLYFTRFWFKVLRNNKFIVNWHHGEICSKLEQIQNYSILYLGINIPPRFSKTELAAVNFIARGIGMNPSGNYLYITASDDLRSETSIRIREIVSHPYFAKMYGVEMKPDQQSKNLWRTKQGGGLKTATIGGQITGFGAGQMVEHDMELNDYVRDFEGCIVLDDINKIDDAEKQNANNDKVLRVIGNTILSRKNSSDTPIINIQQRAGLDDATAYFNELFDIPNNPKAENIIFPVLIEGESLWPWKMPIEEINRIKDHPKTKLTFQSQYMQDPRPDLEKLLFPEEEIKRYKDFPEGEYFEFSFIDPADEGTDNYAQPIMRVYPDLQRVYVHDAIFNQENLTIQEPFVISKVKEHKIREICIETNSFGAYFKRRLIELLPDITIFGKPSISNKLVRMINYSGIVKAYFYFPEQPNHTLSKFMTQMFKITKTSKKEDDAPDSICGAAEYLEKFHQLFI
jgi:predicted phage terminase large subunit-like protein